MKHLIFPTTAQADAFIKDLQDQGVVRTEVGQTSLNRRSATAPVSNVETSATDTLAGSTVVEGGTAEDAGEGAVKGTGVGLVTGAAAAIIGTAVTVGTGGLALPVILGMSALGAGVGAGVGAIGGAAGVDETGDGYQRHYDVDDTHYEQMNQSVSAGGRAVAVDDNVPVDALDAALARHGGQHVR